MTYRAKILNRIKSLEHAKDVSVEISGNRKSFTVRYESQQSLDFYFKWIDKNHFAGYFMDKNKEKSHSVISLWTPLDAVHFATSYSLLVELRAGRPNPL